MSPDQISKRKTEHGEQAAVFAWAAMATLYGFDTANDMTAYSKEGFLMVGARHLGSPIPDLRWLHAIPNGGYRDPRTAAMLKAEGVKPGVADICLPVPRRRMTDGAITYGSLYIEMKTSKGVQSDEQHDFALHCASAHLFYALCRSWREAAGVIQEYLTKVTA